MWDWDYDGVNEMALADIKIAGKDVPALVHFDRHALGYTMNRRPRAIGQCRERRD